MTHFNESKLSRIIARRIIAPEDRSQLLPLCTPIYCPTYNGVRASRVTVINPNTNLFSEDNTFDIDMTIPVNHSYLVPHEVDLKTDVDLVDMIKSDFAVRFKKAVSDEILKQIIANKANIKNIAMAATVADSVGLAIADNIINGTGQKYSIYKYDNGAPVSYIKSSNQPNIDDQVLDEEEPDALLSGVNPRMFKREYALKDDVDVPALYYIEKPTLIFDNAKFTEYQQGLCNGSIKRYADDKINVDTASIDFTSIGEGIFGSNDTFAVAFTEASIKFAPDQTRYADNVCVTVYFGVKLVHTNNLKVFT